MKIKLRGTLTTAQLRQMLYEATHEMEKLGVQHVRGCNLYLTPVDEDGEEVRPVRHGKRIKELAIKPPVPTVGDEYSI